MNISVQSQPSPGSTQPGDLYIDLQSRQLWLGVDTAVDPNGSVLISDLVALQAADTATLSNAKAYTDTSLTPYAKLAGPAFTGNPTALTQVPADNSTRLATTAFVKSALLASSGPFVRGMIMMYSGLLTDIGVDTLAGWQLCDGTNGTPDLRDKFIIGAGNLLQKAPNPLTVATTNTQAAHSHGGSTANYALTVANMPSHAHNVSATGTGSGATDNEAAHTHTSGQGGNLIAWGSSGGAIGTTWGGGQPLQTLSSTSGSGSHAHNVTVSSVTVNGTAAAQGSGTAHGHTINVDAAHAHTVTSAQLRDAIPWLALAYIMKL